VLLEKMMKIIERHVHVNGRELIVWVYHSSEPKAPTSVDVAPPLWAVQPFRVGDEGDALKIEAKTNTTFCGIKH